MIAQQIRVLEESVLNEASFKFNYSIWDLLAVTACIALMLVLPAAAMEILLIGALMIVELGILLIIPVLVINSGRSNPVEGGERVIGQLLLRIFAVAVFVTVFGLLAMTFRPPELI